MNGFITPEAANDFYDELEALFNKYRSLTRDGDTDIEQEQGFDPEAPTVPIGILFMIAETNGNGWTTVFRSVSPTTNHFTAVGMASDFYDWIQQ